MRKVCRIYAFVMAVATIMLFTSTLLPHHHHHGIPCLAMHDCASACAHSGAHSHQASNDGDSDGGNCVGEKNFVSSDRRDANDHVQLLSLDILPALLCCMHTACEYHAVAQRRLYQPLLFKDYTTTLTLCCGLRAPPIA